jgi:hypothetical protein
MVRCRKLSVAYDRCKAHNWDVCFIVANAIEVRKHFRHDSFDLVIFYAVLEHMTHEERRVGMGASWEVLKPGGYCVVTETPNRLWYRDNHTALLPFHHWLPDAVAFEYPWFSKRDYFREVYLTQTPERELYFLRRGRGVSFHEFELFIAPRHELNVIACLHTYLRALNPEEEQRWTDSEDAIYQAVLRRACPDLHDAFLQPDLDRAIRKNSDYRVPCEKI